MYHAKTFLCLSHCSLLRPDTTALGLGPRFPTSPLSDSLFQAMKDGNTFSEEHSPVPIERLRLLTVQHVDFEGKTQTGQLVVLDACAEEVLALFKALYKRQFPPSKNAAYVPLQR